MAVAPAKQPGCDPAAHVDVDVLVVGAGPSGLTAACEAIRYGVTVRIIDRNATRSTFSRALVAHARTVEVFDTMGVVDAILAEGTRFAALNTHSGQRRRRVRLDLRDLPWGDTAYPYRLSIPQYANAYQGGPRVAAPSGGRRVPNLALRQGGRLYQRLDPLGHTLVMRRRRGEPHPDPNDPLLDGVLRVVVPDDALAEPVRDLPG